MNNKKIKISTAGSRKSTSWPPSELLWSEFCDRLKDPVRGVETYTDYMKSPKSTQDELKDVGGFVGGTFKDNRRNLASVEGHDLVTLDLDNIPQDGTDKILDKVDKLGCAAVVYSTRKHAPHAPRLRVIIPTDRTMTPDEYEPCARQLASIIGISYCDKTTFDNNRLMYWPSASKDAEYIYKSYDKQFCSVDGVLGIYADWHDMSSWPTVPGAETIEKRRLAKQEDPTEKSGIIGAFCREYTIPEAMAEFIPELYEPTVSEDRYTFTGGTTTGGAILYGDGKWLYSHHATDPCSGKLVNAFDLIRIHKFSDLDAEAKEGTPVNKLPSFLKMEEFALSNPKVKSRIAQESIVKASDAFGETAVSTEVNTESDGMEWLQELEITKNGTIAQTAPNIGKILNNDINLKGKIAIDRFASRLLAMGELPWDIKKPNKEFKPREWTDADDAGLLWYLEAAYHIYSREKTYQAITLVAEMHGFNEVEAYLNSLEWDGKKRVETLLVDYLGAEDNIYTRAVMKKSLSAAVGRAIVGGVKYDYMPILAGPQGIGKSTFLANLGKQWFSDSLVSFEGKDAAELIQGTWINEVGELTAMNRQETNAVKQFLSKRDDRYRAAYGRRSKCYPRRCVFFGTSNDFEFLKDQTGNRRFWPVDVGINEPTKSVWDDMPGEIDQIWAEAVWYYRLGEPLYLTGEVEEIAKQMQEEHSEQSDKAGIIEQFLDIQLPENWATLDLSARRQYYNGNLKLPEGIKLVARNKVCVSEIWCECFNGDKRYLKRADSMEINKIMSNIPGWERGRNPLHFGPYGKQKGFILEE